MSKNLNIGGNLNVNNGMFYAVNDPQYTKFKSVGVGTMVPRLGLILLIYLITRMLQLYQEH